MYGLTLTRKCESSSLTNSVTLYDVAGAASFGDDSKIIVNLQNVGGVAGTYKIIQAGSLTGADNLTSNVALLPFLFTSSLVTSVPGEVSLKVDLKSADQLGLNPVRVTRRLEEATGMLAVQLIDAAVRHEPCARDDGE